MSKLEHAKLKLGGMSCASCAQKIEKALQAKDGVCLVAVNFVTRQANIDYDPNTVQPIDLVKAVNAAGFQAQALKKHDSHLALLSTEDIENYHILKQRFLISLVLSLPVLFLSMTTWHWPSQNQLMLFLTTLILIGPGNLFFRDAWKALCHQSLNMNSLVALGTGTAYLYSLVITLFPAFLMQPGHAHHSVYFETAAVLTTILLLGRMLEAYAKSNTTASIERLMNLQPKTATVLRNNQEEIVSISALQVGDIIRVRPGEKFPVDGILIEGETTVDESLMTGESLPTLKKKGAELMGATLNQTGSVLYQATKVGEDTLLQQIVRMVQEAQASQAPIQRLADTISGYFVSVVLIIALLSLTAWLLWGPVPQLNFAITAFVSVLIIACPCALGLATPTAILVGTGKGAEHGILIKNGESLEQLQAIDTIVFDKTGTLTQGQLSVTDIVLLGSSQTKDILELAASLEHQSEHPYGKAIVQKALEQGLSLKPVSHFKALPGYGVIGQIENQEVLIGNLQLLNQHDVSLETVIALDQTRLSQGKTTLFVVINRVPAAILYLADNVKPEAQQVITQLKASGLSIIMMTGDAKATASAIASQIGITQVYADLLPQDKLALIQKLQAAGKHVAMIGDGINDAPALTQAMVGIAIGSGTDVALAASDVTLLHQNLTDILKAFALSKQTMRTIRQNLFFAFIYNIIGIPIAAGLLFPEFGILLNPMMAGVAMALSSVCVVLNSLRLQGLTLQ